MRPAFCALMALLISGCQIDPYTHHPDWTGTNWFDAGKEDAMTGSPVKDNETLAENFNDPDVDRSDYLRGYTEGQHKICEEGFLHAWGMDGRTFPASCDTVENAGKLREAWQQGQDEGARASRLN